jgi:hypothetical protein
MSEVLVVTYSYTGTCRQLAQLLCSQQGWPMAEISEISPRIGLQGTARCLLDSWRHRRPPIHYEGPPPEQFDAVVLVSPIWAYRLAGPMRSFVTLMRERLPDVAVVSVMGNSGAPNAVAEIGQLLDRSPILSTAFTTREVQDGSCAGWLQAFGTALQNAEDPEAVLRPAAWSPQAA